MAVARLETVCGSQILSNRISGLYPPSLAGLAAFCFIQGWTGKGQQRGRWSGVGVTLTTE